MYSHLDTPPDSYWGEEPDQQDDGDFDCDDDAGFEPDIIDPPTYAALAEMQGRRQL